MRLARLLEVLVLRRPAPPEPPVTLREYEFTDLVEARGIELGRRYVTGDDQPPLTAVLVYPTGGVWLTEDGYGVDPDSYHDPGADVAGEVYAERWCIPALIGRAKMSWFGTVDAKTRRRIL